jgi:beta-mannosidase
MERMDLTGAWQLRAADDDELIAAQVPGCVHLDLIAAGKIPNPFWRDNEKLVQWVSGRAWCYSREFDITSELLQQDNVVLRCDGLDTLATIRINGSELVRTANMFRWYEFDIKALLSAGTNRIEIEFAPALLHTRELQKQRYIHAWLSREEGVNYIRKEACNYGWDWGPKLVTCGIWKPIQLIAWSGLKLGAVQIEQHHVDGKVELTIRADLHGVSTLAAQLHVTIELDGVQQAAAVAEIDGAQQQLSLTIDKPSLWWPNGMGAQPLYQVSVELRDSAGPPVDSWQRRIGLRTLRLERHDDEQGQSFGFSVNDVPFFAKGANWIPADAFVTRLTPPDYRALLESAGDANMNMLRVWGGGIYEADEFYDICDELGICVWQDFMFACACYPTFDEDWMQNVRIEAEQQVRRLRHHACVALWCGNNELEQGLCGPEWTIHQMPWSEAARLFDGLLGEVVAANDAHRDFWPGSPHTPVGDRKLCNDPNSGDAHLWSVWHGREPFEWYRSSRHRFCSEFGFQSFPEPRTIAAFAAPEDQNISSYVMDFHQRSWVGNGIIMSYMLAWFRQPKDFDSFVWLTQIVQGLAMKYACEHWRRQMPHTMGALYWQLNDTWPGPSWSSIDYFHRWKALHYMARRFFAPLLVSMVEDVSKRQVEIWATNDSGDQFDATLELAITDVAGETLFEQSLQCVLDPRSSRLVHTLHVPDAISRELDWGHISSVPQLTPGGAPVETGVGPRDIMIWAELKPGHDMEASASRNQLTFAKPKHLELRDPDFEVQWDASGSVPGFTITCKYPALFVWFEMPGLEARFSDNFFDMRPGKAVPVFVIVEGDVPQEALRSALVVRSLNDTY